MQTRFSFVLLIAVAMGALSLQTVAQSRNKTEPDWSVNLEGKYLWSQIAPDGTIIVANKDNLMGLNPDNGKVKWKLDRLANLKTENFEVIEGSPLAFVKDRRGVFYDYLVINTGDGSIVADSKEMGLVNSSAAYPVPDINAVLIYGSNKRGKLALVCADVIKGEKRWEQEKFFEKITEMVVAKPHAVENGKAIMLATDRFIYKINAANGEKVWGIDYKNDMGLKVIPAAKVGFFSLEEYPDRVWFSTFDNFTCFNLADGKMIWPNHKIKSPITQFLLYKKHLIVTTSALDDDAKGGKGIGGAIKSAATGGNKAAALAYDYNTGQLVWSKPVELDGTMIDYAYYDDGKKIVVATESKKGVNRINLLDMEAGKMLLKDDFKVDGDLLSVQMTPKGVMYFTTRELNILDPATGKDAWNKSLKFKEPGMGKYKDGKLYIYGDGNFYRFDPDQGEYKVIASNIRFKGKEDPTEVEVRPNGIMARSDQNMLLIDENGKEIYSIYKPAPDKSTFGKVLAITAGVASMAASTGAAARAGYIKGSAGPIMTMDQNRAYENNMKASQDFANLGSAFFAEAGKRFKATFDSKDFTTILTEENKAKGLVVVDKNTGSDIRFVKIDDKEPDYNVDEVGRLIIYAAGKKVLNGYRF